MRTKTLLLTAVLGTAGAVATMAQVYSVNVVGYITVQVPAGFSIIANQFTQGGNTLSEVLTNGVGNLDTVFTFDPATGNFNSARYIAGTWTQNLVLSPGVGAFYSAAAARTLTFTGSMDATGAAQTIPLTQGFQLIGSPLPFSGSITNSQFAFPAVNLDTIFTFDPSTQTYSSARYIAGNWTAPVNLALGQGFWLNRSGTAGAWTESFSF